VAPKKAEKEIEPAEHVPLCRASDGAARCLRHEGHAGAHDDGEKSWE